MKKPTAFPAVPIAVAALFVLGAHSTSVQAQECVSQLRQQKLQMLRLAGECNVRADLIGSIDRRQRALPETECRRPIGVSGQLDSFTECARVYLCAAQSFNCAIRKASQGQDCIGASNACLRTYPVPQGRAAASGAGEAPPALDREAWRRVQSALAALGFDPGQPDGKFGPMTRKALHAWQQALGYAADGELTSGQVELLLAAAGLMLAAAGPPDASAPGAARQDALGRRPPDASATGAAGDTRYEGGYRDGKRHGYGVYTFASGDRYEGEWRDGEEHGRGTYTLPNGSAGTCEYRDGWFVQETCKFH